MHKAIKPLLIFCSMFISFISYAGGTIELPQTGQTISYAAGDNGNIQAGVAWPDPRFTDNGNETVTDNLTGLMFPKQGNITSKKTWQEALDFVASVNSDYYLGFNDWRLPNVNELVSLVDYSRNNPSFPEGYPFSYVYLSSYYWSSSTCSNDKSTAYELNYDIGYIGISYKNNSHYVWLVRSGQTGTIQLPQTGQTKCYDTTGTEISCIGTGQDGEIHAGVAWPSPRFTDNGNETITDNLTGLMFTKDGNLTDVKTWQGAIDYVAYLNSSNYLGFNDWRLPNINELKSLLNTEETDSSVWLNTQGFTNIQSNGYWSSTSASGSASGSDEASAAWYINMLDGGVYSGKKNPIYYDDDRVYYDNKSYLSRNEDGSIYGYYCVLPVRAGTVERFGPSVISLSPSSAKEGKKLDVTISGVNFTGAESVSFGPYIKVITFTVVSDTQIIANIKTDNSVSSARDVTVSTSNGIGIGGMFLGGKFPDFKALSVTCPNTVKNGKTVTIKAVIKNIGNKYAASPYNQFYLSVNNDSSTIEGDTALKFRYVKLKAKQSSIIKYNWKVNVAPGTYYIKVLCDLNDNVTESNENNNITVSKKIVVK